MGVGTLLAFCSLFLYLNFNVLASEVSLGDGFSRDEFPDSFVFGAGTSAYQAEGATKEDGRGPCAWDIYTHQGKMPDKSTGDITADQYHKYKEDVKLMSDIGLEAYRFSISWSRLIPKGRGAINPKGIEFYNNFIDELVKHGIEPHVTLHHLDFPQALQDEYGGWLSPRILEDFTAYAELCFREFGDRVTHWTTVNEPNVYSIAAYDIGFFPPQRCTPSMSFFNCSAGNSSMEPYLALHHQLLAHASVTKLYREKYQAKQKGLVGINIYTFWFTPFTNSTADVEATQRSLDFYIGWIANPLVFGDYPKIMKKNAGSRLPSFTQSESELVKGAFDFFGINYYAKAYVEDRPLGPPTAQREFNSDIFANFRLTKDQPPSGQLLPFSFPIDPTGITNLLDYMNQAYGNPPIYVQENGMGTPFNVTVNDTGRIDYLRGYINGTLQAIRHGSNVKGYFVWSFLDVFEYLGGFQSRFGLVYVDFEDKERTRKLKLSAHWYSKFLKNKKSRGIKIEYVSRKALLDCAK